MRAILNRIVKALTLSISITINDYQYSYIVSFCVDRHPKPKIFIFYFFYPLLDKVQNIFCKRRKLEALEIFDRPKISKLTITLMIQSLKRYSYRKREKMVYLEAEADSSSSQFLICLTFRRNMAADCLTSDLRSSTTALTPATVRMKLVNAIDRIRIPNSKLNDRRNTKKSEESPIQGFFKGLLPTKETTSLQGRALLLRWALPY